MPSAKLGFCWLPAEGQVAEIHWQFTPRCVPGCQPAREREGPAQRTVRVHSEDQLHHLREENSTWGTAPTSWRHSFSVPPFLVSLVPRLVTYPLPDICQTIWTISISVDSASNHSWAGNLHTSPTCQQISDQVLHLLVTLDSHKIRPQTLASPGLTNNTWFCRLLGHRECSHLLHPITARNFKLSTKTLTPVRGTIHAAIRDYFCDKPDSDRIKPDTRVSFSFWWVGSPLGKRVARKGQLHSSFNLFLILTWFLLTCSLQIWDLVLL